MPEQSLARRVRFRLMRTLLALALLPLVLALAILALALVLSGGFVALLVLVFWPALTGQVVAAVRARLGEDA